MAWAVSLMYSFIGSIDVRSWRMQELIKHQYNLAKHHFLDILIISNQTKTYMIYLDHIVARHPLSMLSAMQEAADFPAVYFFICICNFDICHEMKQIQIPKDENKSQSRRARGSPHFTRYLVASNGTRVASAED